MGILCHSILIGWSIEYLSNPWAISIGIDIGIGIGIGIGIDVGIDRHRPG